MYTHTLYIPLAAGHHRSDENATGETGAVIKVKLGTDTVLYLYCNIYRTSMIVKPDELSHNLSSVSL